MVVAVATSLLPRRRGDEAKANAANRSDITRPFRVVPEFSTQGADVARQRVIEDTGLGPPERVRKLAIGHDRSGSCGQRVQEDVLVRRKPHVAIALPDALMKRIDLKIGNPKRSHSTTGGKAIAWQRDQFRSESTCPHDEVVIQ